MDKKLHIVSFNVPYPPDYGGVIDVYFRIKALSELGVEIILHTFQYGRKEAEQLEAICNKVFYYPRSISVAGQFSTLPFIVNSRKSKLLLKNLCSDNQPILFEGLHCCAYLAHPRLANRFKMVRAHNKEHDYYRKLARQSAEFLKIIYFNFESIKLRWFEKKLKHANHIFSISNEEQDYFLKSYHTASLLMPFHPNEKVEIKTGMGDYILYHGNLEVEENVESARFIMEEIAPLTEHPIVLAGKNPGENLHKLAAKKPNVNIIANPSHDEMNYLIQNAHINLLITFQDTGFKLKLMNALFNGRFCLVNLKMVKGTGFDSLCNIKNTVNELIAEIDTLFQLNFTDQMISEREALLNKTSSNRDNAIAILKQIPDFLLDSTLV